MIPWVVAGAATVLFVVALRALGRACDDFDASLYDF